MTAYDLWVIIAYGNNSRVMERIWFMLCYVYGNNPSFMGYGLMLWFMKRAYGQVTTINTDSSLNSS